MVTKMAAAATTEHKSGEPQSPTRPVSPEIRPRVPVSSQMEKARTSRTKIAARNARRCHNPGHRGAVGGRVDWLAARAGSDRRLDLSITKSQGKTDIQVLEVLETPGCPVCLEKRAATAFGSPE